MFLALIFIILLVSVSEILNDLKATREAIRSDMKKHQEWLFEQLYRQTPGQVLRPDESEEVIESKPAEVYKPYTEPMAEFTGKRNDWHGNS